MIFEDFLVLLGFENAKIRLGFYQNPKLLLRQRKSRNATQHKIKNGRRDEERGVVVLGRHEGAESQSASFSFSLSLFSFSPRGGETHSWFSFSFPLFFETLSPLKTALTLFYAHTKIPF
jgi:hypothetical protein